MLNMSFFPKVIDGATECRSHQMAEYLGAKFNPSSGYENDICIFVKKYPPVPFPRHSYYDVVDAPRAGSWLLLHPEMGVIVSSNIQYNYYHRILKRDDLILIPHHHCNYERFKRENRPIKTIGVIGNMNSVQSDEGELGDKFVKLGLNYIHRYKYNCRADVVNFYKKIDIQVIWRPRIRAKLHNPLKLVNAGSFGIPTVSYPESNFVAECDGCFIPVTSIDGMIEQVCKLRDNNDYYDEISNRAIEKSEEYHIEHIAKLYRQLT